MPNQDELIKSLVSASKMARPILFDLDNTLYAETDFLRQVYHWFLLEIGVERASTRALLVDSMLKMIISGRRSSMLQETFLKYEAIFRENGIDVSRQDYFVEVLLRNLRSPSGDINLTLFPWFSRFLESGLDPARIALVTNGNVTQQETKVRLLGLEKVFLPDLIMYADSHDPKPSPAVAKILGGRMDLRNAIFVGDSAIDYEFAKRAGFDFYPVRSSSNCSFTLNARSE